MNYENQIGSIIALTTPTGGTKIWQTATPNRINENLPDEQNNALQIKLLKELDQDELEATMQYQSSHTTTFSKITMQINRKRIST